MASRTTRLALNMPPLSTLPGIEEAYCGPINFGDHGVLLSTHFSRCILPANAGHTEPIVQIYSAP